MHGALEGVDRAGPAGQARRQTAGGDHQVALAAHTPGGGHLQARQVSTTGVHPLPPDTPVHPSPSSPLTQVLPGLHPGGLAGLTPLYSVHTQTLTSFQA